jgi:hypothetical protein
MIEIISPAGFEHFFWGVTELASSGPPDPEGLGALAAEHGLVFGNAPWLQDVITRYHLTPPPGALSEPQPTGDVRTRADRKL